SSSTPPEIPPQEIDLGRATLHHVQRWRGVADLPGDWGRCVVTIGVFDGVHKGHQALIRQTVRTARQRGLPSVVLTFDPHPAEVLRPGSHPAQLTTLTRKAELIEQLGVDVLAVLPFTPELARLSPEEVAHELLVEPLHDATVIVGETLRELGKRFGFTAHEATLEGHSVSENGGSAEITYSSTYVRSCINAGDVVAAAEALGRPHRLEGIVVRGEGRGRELGFPTANLSLPAFSAVPADGVYACWFVRQGRDEEPLPAAVSVGTNPTFSGRERTVEAFVLDFDADLYGQQVALDCVSRLMGQSACSASEKLVGHIA